MLIFRGSSHAAGCASPKESRKPSCVTAPVSLLSISTKLTHAPGGSKAHGPWPSSPVGSPSVCRFFFVSFDGSFVLVRSTPPWTSPAFQQERKSGSEVHVAQARPGWRMQSTRRVEEQEMREWDEGGNQQTNQRSNPISSSCRFLPHSCLTKPIRLSSAVLAVVFFPLSFSTSLPENPWTLHHVDATHHNPLTPSPLSSSTTTMMINNFHVRLSSV